MVAVRQSRKLSLANRILLWINYFFIVGLLVSLSAKYVPPQLFWFIAFFGLAFPYFVLLNIFFVIYWIVQFRRIALFSLSTLFISSFTIVKYVQISTTGTKNNSDIKVTSYNSMLFDLYNWSKNAQSRRNILSSLQEINPDILCLQEFYNSDEANDFHNIDTVVSLFATKYFHVEYTTHRRETDHWGIATFSKYPIVNKGKIVFNTYANNICIYTDILINKDTVRIYNVHLQSISFTKDEIKFVTDISEGDETKDEVEFSKSILRRLKKAFIRRAGQAEKVITSINSCRYPVVLCGDFNDTPASYTYHLFSENLKDAFVEKGTGFGKTYAGKFPQFRIDYILHSKEMKCNGFLRSDETFTDHYPITAYLDLRK